MVEFAIILPVMLLTLFGIIEFGRLLQAWLSVENGARFGVRYEFTRANAAAAPTPTSRGRAARLRNAPAMM